MLDSIALAKILGILFFVAGISVIINPKHLLKGAQDYFKSSGLMLFGAFLPTFLGALILALHNSWTQDWTIAITIVGWLALLRGVVRFWFPDFAADVAKKAMDKIPLALMGVVTTALGAFFLYNGFMG